MIGAILRMGMWSLSPKVEIGQITAVLVEDVLIGAILKIVVLTNGSLT